MDEEWMESFSTWYIWHMALFIARLGHHSEADGSQKFWMNESSFFRNPHWKTIVPQYHPNGDTVQGYRSSLGTPTHCNTENGNINLTNMLSARSIRSTMRGVTKPQDDAQTVVHSFMPDFSNGILVPPPPLNKQKRKKESKKTASASPPSSPSRDDSNHTNCRSSKKCQKYESAPRRRSLSWLAAAPAPCPQTPRSAKRSASRALPKRSRKQLPSSPWHDQKDENQQLRSSSHSRGSTATFLTFGSMDTLDPSVDGYPSMSYGFPMTSETQKVVFRKQSNQRGVSIETNTGELIGSIDVIREGDIRLLKDVSGKTCGIILHTRENSLGGANVFQVYCNKPSTPRQKPSKSEIVNGCYLWAEIKNTGSMGGKFVMKRYSPETFTCSVEQHSTKPFGSLFAKDKSKGYTFSDCEEKECIKMVSLRNKGKGIAIAPYRDTGLLLAFCAVVDEMVERRLR